MFFTRRSQSQESALEPSAQLREAVASNMSDADDGTIAILGALAGLLAQVAHADNTLDEAELEEIRGQLARIDGLSGEGVVAVLALLRSHGKALFSEGTQSYTRVLYEQCAREMRLEVLDLLMDVAAADGSVSMDETHLIRRICTALGLSDADYLASQTRYRDHLSVLK